MSHNLIARDYIYRGKILDVSLSRFNSDAKGEVQLEIVHHNGGAGTLPLFDDGSIALVRSGEIDDAKSIITLLLAEQVIHHN